MGLKNGNMKFSYKKAIEWIAENDEPREIDLKVISEMISVLLIADLAKKDPIEVAKKIADYRIKHIYGATE